MSIYPPTRVSHNIAGHSRMRPPHRVETDKQRRQPGLSRRIVLYSIGRRDDSSRVSDASIPWYGCQQASLEASGADTRCRTGLYSIGRRDNSSRAMTNMTVPWNGSVGTRADIIEKASQVVTLASIYNPDSLYIIERQFITGHVWFFIHDIVKL